VNYATALLNVALQKCQAVLNTPAVEHPAEEPDL
jgi:hypothetical protein